jgi:hypothetical protein
MPTGLEQLKQFAEAETTFIVESRNQKLNCSIEKRSHGLWEKGYPNSSWNDICTNCFFIVCSNSTRWERSR